MHRESTRCPIFEKYYSIISLSREAKHPLIIFARGRPIIRRSFLG
jgi:hypothetical protein